MNIKSQKGFVITLTTAIGLLLVIIAARGITHNHFRNNADKWSEKSLDQSNLVTPENLKLLKANILVINLNSKQNVQSDNHSSVSVHPEEILEKSNFKTINDFEGIKILVSDDPALSARLWMLLSQMGIKDLYILNDKAL